MKKHGTALITAFLITLVVGMGMFLIGGNAILNKTVVPVRNSPGQENVSNVTASNQSQLEQYQNLIAQYQQREQQYQTELNNAQNQLDQASATIQQYQELFTFLQQRGAIQVSQDGRIFIPGD